MLVLHDTIANMQKFIIAKCMQDPAFKAQFLANPRGTVESAFKVSLPAHVQIEVRQGAPNTVSVVLPHDAAPGPDGELTDGDLEAVAGGAKSGDMATWGATHPQTRMSAMSLPGGAVPGLGGAAPASGASPGIIAGDQICF